MAIDQLMLLHAASSYHEQLNQEFFTGNSLVPVAKRRIFISHSLDSFRMVEGFIILMRQAGIDAFFDWDSGNLTDESRHEMVRDMKVRIAKAEIFILLATENSVEDETCRRAYEFASIINRRIYVVHTISGKTEWKPPIPKYDQLSIERTMRNVDKLTVKVLEHRRQQLWNSIGNVWQL